ncbi:MAG: TVP38/TMEM64 family protein [Acidimicrobiales bacterium]
MSAVPAEPGRAGDGRRRAVALVVWVGAVVGWLGVSRARGIGPLDAAESLRSVLAGNWWGPLLYVLVYALRPLILFPASVLTVLGGLAFGPVAGVVYTVVGSNLSTATTYGAARFVTGRRRLTPPVGRRVLDGLVDHPFETTLVLRLLAAPFDAVGVAAGALGLRFWPFLAGSFLGTIAGTVAFVSFGASLESLTDASPSLDGRLLAVSVALMVGGVAVARLLRRRRPDLADPMPEESST